MTLHDPGQAREFAAFLRDATGLRVTSWQERNTTLEGALFAQAQTGTLIQIFSLISVLIGIASALSLSANRRRGEIGIMGAFGVARRFIAAVFVLQGLLIGMVGAGIGCLTGFALCSWLATLTKADGTTQADSHRYKQCGNGVASPVAQWIAKHILAI